MEDNEEKGKSELCLGDALYCKILRMKLSELVQVMVAGLRHPSTPVVDLSTFGDTKPGTRGEVCVGCAATNAISRLAGQPFEPYNIYTRKARAWSLRLSRDFLQKIESGFDRLAQSNIDGAVERFIFAGLEIEYPPAYYGYLPALTTTTFPRLLHYYESYSKWLAALGY